MKYNSSMKKLSKVGASQSRYYTVYMITNNITKERYIGQHITKNLKDDYMGSGKRIKEQIARYGRENFNKQTLKVFDNFEEMNQSEIDLISELKPELNISSGGEGWFGVNQSMTKQTIIERNRKNIAKFHEKLRDPEYHEHFRKKFIGRPCSEKSREFIRQWNKEHGSPNKGKKLSEDTKNKIRQSLLEYNRKKKLGS